MSYDRQSSEESSPLALILHRLASIEASQERDRQEDDKRGQLLANIDKNMALGNQRMNEIDAHLESTDKRVDTIEADHRVSLGLWTSVVGFLTSAAAVLGTMFGPHKP